MCRFFIKFDRFAHFHHRSNRKIPYSITPRKIFREPPKYGIFKVFCRFFANQSHFGFAIIPPLCYFKPKLLITSTLSAIEISK